MQKNEKQRIILIPLIIVATFSLLFFKAEKLKIITQPLLQNAYLDGELKYQIITFGLACIILLLTYLCGPMNFKKFFAIGQIDAVVEPVKFIGLNPKPHEGWLKIGRNFAIIISLVTLIFIYLQAIRGNHIDTSKLCFLPWIIIFAIVNSFVEEMITRFAVVAALSELIPRQLIFLVSAAIFGTVHFFGTPGGITGVALAGFLGWLLAKSIYETHGIFWAWLIHFLQDVIIFTGLFFVYL